MRRRAASDRVRLDARLAFKEGFPTFSAGVAPPPGVRVSRREARKALKELIAAVEAEGWKAEEIETVGMASEVLFVRR